MRSTSGTRKAVHCFKPWLILVRDRVFSAYMSAHHPTGKVFHQALSMFQHLRIYANAVNDTTVPYPTAGIELDDIFAKRNLDLVEMYVHSPVRALEASADITPQQVR